MSPFPLQAQHFNRKLAILPSVKTGAKGEYQTETELRSVFFRLPIRFLWLIFYQNSLADLPNDICTFHKISDTIKSRSTEKTKKER